MQFGEKTLERWLQTLNITSTFPAVEVNACAAAPAAAAAAKAAPPNPHVGATAAANGPAPNGNHKPADPLPPASPDVGATSPLPIEPPVGHTDPKVKPVANPAISTISTSPLTTSGNSHAVDYTKAPGTTGGQVSAEPAVVPEEPAPNTSKPPASIPNGKPAPQRLSWAQRVAINVPQQPEFAAPQHIGSPKALPSPVTPQNITPPPPLPPRCIRGMVNAGNTCFINVILQALMACDDFRRYFLGARNATDPLVSRLAALASDMSLPPESKPQIVRDSKSLPNVAEPLMPDWASEIFPSTLPKPVGGGRAIQEDAQEFLGFLLNKLHDILVSENAKESATVEPDDSGDWQEMTRKGRPVTVRPVNSADTSAIADIFGFILRAEIKRPRATATMTRETNMFIQLDISSGMIRNVDDALLDYFRAERIEGETNGESQDIRKSCYMETLPKVLILHLKRFAHTRETNRQNKVGRSIGVNEELVIPSQAVFGQTAPAARKYRLTAVVVHAGKDLRGGHYYGDVRVRNGDRDIWVSCDDSKVSQVNIQKVLRRQAYLLFYSKVMNTSGNGVRR